VVRDALAAEVVVLALDPAGHGVRFVRRPARPLEGQGDRECPVLRRVLRDIVDRVVVSREGRDDLPDRGARQVDRDVQRARARGPLQGPGARSVLEVDLGAGRGGRDQEVARVTADRSDRVAGRALEDLAEREPVVGDPARDRGVVDDREVRVRVVHAVHGALPDLDRVEDERVGGIAGDPPAVAVGDDREQGVSRLLDTALRRVRDNVPVRRGFVAEDVPEIIAPHRGVGPLLPVLDPVAADGHDFGERPAVVADVAAGQRGVVDHDEVRVGMRRATEPEVPEVAFREGVAAVPVLLDVPAITAMRDVPEDRVERLGLVLDLGPADQGSVREVALEPDRRVPRVLDPVDSAVADLPEREAGVELVAPRYRRVRDHHVHGIDMIDASRAPALDKVLLVDPVILVPEAGDLPLPGVLLDGVERVVRRRQDRSVDVRDDIPGGQGACPALQDVPHDKAWCVCGLRTSGEQAERQQQDGRRREGARAPAFGS